jgi:hypothetical protein
MFFFIPAGDVMTGKKVNALSDIVATYKNETPMTIFVLKVDGRARPVFLTSHGVGDIEQVGAEVKAEHTQTRAILYTEILNKITINSLHPGSVTAEGPFGLEDTCKGAHWVMK